MLVLEASSCTVDASSLTTEILAALFRLSHAAAGVAAANLLTRSVYWCLFLYFVVYIRVLWCNGVFYDVQVWNGVYSFGVRLWIVVYWLVRWRTDMKCITGVYCAV